MSPTTQLIIGASRGIGLGVVKESLTRYPAVKIFATARNPSGATELQKLLRENPSRLEVLKLDTLDEDSVAAAATQLRAQVLTLDAIVLVAGVAIGRTPLEEVSSECLVDNFSGNVVGAHNIFKALTPFLTENTAKEQKTFAVISTAGASVGITALGNAMVKKAMGLEYFPLSAYAISKTALNMLSRQWAFILEPQGVAVPLVHPGAVTTDMNPGPGGISVEESAKGIWDQLDKVTIEACGKGMFSYSGGTIPW